MPRVVIRPAGQVLRVKKGAALADVADAQATPLDFGCRDGVCGTCIVTVLRGRENLSPCTVHEEDTLANFDAAPNQRLACQLRILGDVEIEIP